MAADVHDVVDCIVVKWAGRGGLGLFKLHKLLYYIQAWSLAVNGQKAFDASFQAWVHGPVCRAVFDRFCETHSLYDSIGGADTRACFHMETIPQELVCHIDEVLESYGDLTGFQLGSLTNREDPWLKARGNLPGAARCEAEISEDLMRDYYARVLAEVEKEPTQIEAGGDAQNV